MINGLEFGILIIVILLAVAAGTRGQTIAVVVAFLAAMDHNPPAIALACLIGYLFEREHKGQKV